MAVQNGDQEIVHLLVDYQADINSPNYRRITPLAVACKLQDWQMVNHLLDKKVSRIRLAIPVVDIWHHLLLHKPQRRAYANE